MPGGTSSFGGGERADGGEGADLAPGTILDGRWRIEALLGTGGMGSVYRAEHVQIGRKAAVKVLHAELCRSPSERVRFRREARVASRLRSPHVVEVLDFGEDPSGRAYIAMELLEGEPLRAVLQREGRLSPQRTVRLLRQLLGGLSDAHAAGIVHRDLKPENLWISGSGESEQLRVLDFGIAKWSEARPDSARTQAGLVVGTPEYLAPEQAVGGEVDHRADLYAVGILAFVMLVGRHPFDTSDVRALVAAQAFERVPGLSSAAPELAAWPKLVDFVARAAEKDRARRPGSAAELAALLDGAELPVRASAAPSPDAAPPQHTSEAVRASLLGIPSAALPTSVNLTLVRVELVEWSQRAEALAPAAQARVLAEHDALVLPVVRAFGGRRLAAEDGAGLFAFHSPTDAAQCAAALQDAAAGGKAEAQPPWTVALGVGIHQGEIHFEKGSVSGTPLATVKAVAASAGPGEVWLTRAVLLTMSRTEAPAEEMGPRLIDGEPEAVVLYRLVRDRGELPYAGRHLARAGARRSRFLEPVTTPLASIQIAGETEGRTRATARVASAAAGLCVAGAVGAAAEVARALLRATAFVTRARPEPPGLLARAIDAIERMRTAALARGMILSLATRRPRAPRGG